MTAKDNVPERSLLSATIYLAATPEPLDWRLFPPKSGTDERREIIHQANVVVLPAGPDACDRAVQLAEETALAVDRLNLTLGKGPRRHLRVGVAVGSASESPFNCPTYEEARKLAEQAGVDQVLVSKEVVRWTKQPMHRFAASRSLQAYRLRVNRLLKAESVDFFRKGLVALYPDRDTLSKALIPVRLMDLATEGTTILVAGRTLKSWTGLIAEMRDAALHRNLRFDFLLSSIESCAVLTDSELAEVRRDSAESRDAFAELASYLGEAFTLRETNQAIIDGATCVILRLPGEPDPNRRTLLVIQDINAALGKDKPALVFACAAEEPDCACMAHGIYRRTQQRFERAAKLEPQPFPPLQPLLRRPEGLRSRSNRPCDYGGRLPVYFEALQRFNRFEPADFPPPLCVQIQVTGMCSTDCVMCDHHAERRQGLEVRDWKKVFAQLKSFQVDSCVFSGGEPLVRSDLSQLLREAYGHGLQIGLLTNGTMSSKDEDFRKSVLDSICQYVSWVAVSVDGVPEHDGLIRNPRINEDNRIDRIKEFCDFLRDNLPDTKPYAQFISATVTLQKNNIRADLRSVCDFIHERLGIPQVNFKLATGARSTLPNDPLNYLLSVEDVQQLRHFLWNTSLPDQSGNNLAYLRRALASGLFTAEDVADGAPLRSFYGNLYRQQRSFRCFAPLIFALIDLNGDVYPCCHLYRDNHGVNPMSKTLRDKHRVGNVLQQTFSAIWNDLPYQAKRRQLNQITQEGDFIPCGECTRYCQHNLATNAMFQEWQKDPHALDTFPKYDGPVWL